MKKLHKILLALLSGVLLSVAWPATGSLTPLLLVALVPLLFLYRKAYEAKKEGRKEKLFLYAYLTFFTFNLLTTWWVWYASAFGAVMAIVLNTLFITIVFQLVHFTRLHLGNKPAAFALIFYWVAWEMFHMGWDLSWPWLTLGNGLAAMPWMAQWYEYTGVLGGSVWILVSNLLVTNWLLRIKRLGLKPYQLPAVLLNFKWYLWIVFPVGISNWMFTTYVENKNPVEVVVIQPNIDPYNEKFGGVSSEDQVRKMVAMAEEKITPNTDFVVAPETAIPKTFDEAIFERTIEYRVIDSLLYKYPYLDYITGASTYLLYHNKAEKSVTARYSAQADLWYDNCNTAVEVSAIAPPEFYHKSKLVPGVEMMPFPSFFMHFQEFAFNLGGSVGSLGRQDNRAVFGGGDKPKIAPVICYESIYGAYLGGYIENGAELIFIITNDGWWRDTPGYKQHMMYASLAAIEHRRCVARSANTGISCFVDQRGIITDKTEWWTPDVIRKTINANSKVTFYSTYGDYIGRIGMWFGGLILLFAFSRKLMNKK